MTGKWISLTEACQSLGVSESTLRRRINEGKVESKLEDGRRLVLIKVDSQYSQIDGQTPGSTSDLIERLKEEVEHLRQELNRRNEQIERLQTQIDEKDNQMERLHQLLAIEKTQTQQLLEHQLLPFWKRWRRKQLPEATHRAEQ